MTTPALIAVLTTPPFSPPLYKFTLPKLFVVPAMEPSSDIVMDRPPSRKRRANSSSPMPRVSLTSVLTTTSPAYRHFSALPLSPSTPVLNDLPTISAPSRPGLLDLTCYSPLTRSPLSSQSTNSPPSPSLLKPSTSSTKSLGSIVDQITKAAAASSNTPTTSAGVKHVSNKSKCDKPKSAKSTG